MSVTETPAAVSDKPDSRAEPEAVAPNKSWLQATIAVLAIVGIGANLALRFGAQIRTMLPGNTVQVADVPLLIVLALGGGPLLYGLIVKMLHRQFGSDLLAGISIVTSVLLHEYLAGALVVLMLSGGEALEVYAARSASSVLHALSRRMPHTATRKSGETLEEIPLDQIEIGDLMVVLPHGLCPVDGEVVEGHGFMDESYLTGEPYQIAKAPGVSVLSGAVNGDAALTIRCDRRAQDSRYARIMNVMKESEQRRPRLRRLGDQLGAWYTPVAVSIGLAAWAASSDPVRFLSVLVIATPCPLLIAIPIAIIGSISLAARKGIIIKDPAVLENISRCKVAIFDKTGTLTYGRPKLMDVLTAPGIAIDSNALIGLVAGAERYSKHPLATSIVEAANERSLKTYDAKEVRELPGEGLHARIEGRTLQVTGRNDFIRQYPDEAKLLPAIADGLECIVLLDGRYAATMRFRDEPRAEGAHFIQHLAPMHGVLRTMLVSGDREAEVAYLAKKVGIDEVYANQSPEQKLELVRAETAKGKTLFLGDGINDAPALTAASIGIAFGNNSEITGEAADAVIMDSSLEKVDVLFHIGHRLRSIALQSAVGGMALSIIGMVLAATGRIGPVTGAVGQEVIDVVAVVNALRAAMPPKVLSDY